MIPIIGLVNNMRQWFIGFNEYWYNACIFLENTPWFYLALDYIVERICYVLNLLEIKLPKKLQEEYGGLGGVWHVFVCIPVTNYTFKKTKREMIYLPYFYLRERFPKEMDGFDWDLFDDDEQIKTNEKEAKKLDKEFRSVYTKVEEWKNEHSRVK